MLKERLICFFEQSFLKDLLCNPNITDISFNGEHIYYLDNHLGRLKSNIEISKEEAKEFIRQIANLSEKQFSFSEPILDVHFGKYRINAIHQSLGTVLGDESISFSIRIASTELRFCNENIGLPKDILCRLFQAIDHGESIAIGGKTGSGKTELQKYLITLIPDNKRLIIIDNISELDCLKRISNQDLTTLKVDERNSSLPSLIKNSLRSNPDWLVLAECRGGEMLDVLNASMSGHPTITTVHASSIKSMHSRLTRLSMMGNNQIDYEFTYKDVVEQFSLLIYMNVHFDPNKGMARYIESIGTVENGVLNIIFERKMNP